MRRAPPRGRRSARRTQTSSVWPWVAVGAIALCVIGGTISAAIMTSKAARYDKVTLCNVRGPSAVTVVLIDATDNMSAVQRTAVLNRLARISDQLVANERLSIFQITPSGNLLSPKFSMCRPISAAETSALTGNKRLAAEQFEKKFKPAANDALNGLLTATAAEKSPIMEGIQAAAVSAFQAADVPSTAPKRLVVVSDMLEHASAGSHYQGIPDFDAYRETSQFQRATSDLTGVNVIILYIRRDAGSSVQGLKHVDFWSRWFSVQGADEIRSIPVEG